MLRDPDDDFVSRRALSRWITEKPTATIVVACSEQLQDGTFDVDLRLSRHSVGDLVAMAHALVTAAVETSGAKPGSFEMGAMLHELLAVFQSGPTK